MRNSTENLFFKDFIKRIFFHSQLFFPQRDLNEMILFFVYLEKGFSNQFCPLRN